MPRYGGSPEQMHKVKVSGCAERVVSVLWRTERDCLDELNASFPELARALRACAISASGATSETPGVTPGCSSSGSWSPP